VRTLLKTAAFTIVFAPQLAHAFPSGDVFVSVSNGQVKEFTPAGVLVRTLDTGKGGFTTGSAFDSAGNFYVTDFSASLVSKFDPTGTLLGTFGSGNSINV
jgi:DNA-binding beta-propeller fold protein YncE